MTTVNVYLTFDGNCMEAFDFYKSVFGGEYISVNTFGEMPPQEGMPELSDEEKGKIMHVSLPIGGETILMASDIGTWESDIVVGNNFSICISPANKEEADRLFNALSAGGKVTMPIDEMFWGAYYGSFTDKFGINWMVNYSEPQS